MSCRVGVFSETGFPVLRNSRKLKGRSGAHGGAPTFRASASITARLPLRLLLYLFESSYYHPVYVV